MQRPFTQTANRRQRRYGVVLLALLGIFWAQFAAAAHQFEHLATDFADACEICVQFDRGDDADIADACVATAEARPAVAGVSQPAALSSVAPCQYRPRGPPTA